MCYVSSRPRSSENWVFWLGSRTYTLFSIHAKHAHTRARAHTHTHTHTHTLKDMKAHSPRTLLRSGKLKYRVMHFEKDNKRLTKDFKSVTVTQHCITSHHTTPHPNTTQHNTTQHNTMRTHVSAVVSQSKPCRRVSFTPFKTDLCKFGCAINTFADSASLTHTNALPILHSSNSLCADSFFGKRKQHRASKNKTPVAELAATSVFFHWLLLAVVRVYLQMSFQRRQNNSGNNNMFLPHAAGNNNNVHPGANDFSNINFPMPTPSQSPSPFAQPFNPSTSIPMPNFPIRPQNVDFSVFSPSSNGPENAAANLMSFTPERMRWVIVIV